MSKNKIYKPQPISGFPEWLPEQRRIELQWLDHIRRVFESYGYTNIETPAVEELDVILAKGETDKEIYQLERLQADERDSSDARLGLHFDLTVPFARYTAQHFNELDFPFKRYQIQKVWRGERPQAGRFREFYQCDIDVINPEQLPIAFDAEMPLIIDEILRSNGIEGYTILLNNRKIIEGYLAGLGLSEEQRPLSIRIMDKHDKIGADKVVEMLVSELNLDQAVAEQCTQLFSISSSDDSFAQAVRDLGVENDILAEGLGELSEVMQILNLKTQSTIKADLSIVRGFDYYTGTVYECKFDNDPGFGSIVSGGRYANLAGSYINRQLPGVGISIGLTRLLSKLFDEDKLDIGRKSPTDVLVVVPHKDKRDDAYETGHALRSRGMNVEVYHSAGKIGKQLGYAEKKGIPFVWFPPFDEEGAHEVKDMANGDQIEADPNTWVVPIK